MEQINNICSRQATEKAVQIGSAFREAYFRAKRWKRGIWCATAALSLLQLQSALWPVAFEFSDAATFAVLIFNMLLVTIGKNHFVDGYVRLGALSQQKWDHYVLSIGRSPSRLELPESKIRALSAQWAKRKPEDLENLRSWFAPSIASVPNHMALVLSLYANSSWESELRKRYTFWLEVMLVITIVASLVVGGLMEIRIPDLMINIIMPLTPLLTLLVEELLGCRKNREVAYNSRREAFRLYEMGLDSNDDHELIYEQTGELWDDWQRFRKGAAPIFELFYWASRKRMDDSMLVDSGDLVNEYSAKTASH